MDPFTGLPLNSLTAVHLHELVARARPEDMTLEYKESLDLNGTEQKKEFLRDITAFLNAHGGLIIYGIPESRDADGAKTGLPEELRGFEIWSSEDDIKRQLDQIVRDGIDEPVPAGLDLEVINVEDDRYAIIIRIPKSFRAPHKVTLQNEHRFYQRTTAGRAPMSAAQIKDSVLASETYLERARGFVDKQEQPGQTAAALYVVPLSSPGNYLEVSDEAIAERLEDFLLPGYRYPPRLGYCLEGLRLTPEGAELPRFTFFREGAVEFIYSAPPPTVGMNGDEARLIHWFIEPSLIRALDQSLALFREGLLHMPAAIFLCLWGVNGKRLYTGDPPMDQMEEEVRDIHPIPWREIGPFETMVMNSGTNPGTLLRPLFDVLWNASGHPRCPSYNDDGSHRWLNVQ
jgi:hypothetical protein